MEPTSQSWGTIEETVLTDIAKWKSKSGTERGEELAALVEGALVTPTEKGVTTVKIGRLQWELTPPVDYAGYCETKDDWMLVSGSKFKLAVRSPHGTTQFCPLQVCPQNDEVAFIGSQALLPLSMQNLGLREGSRATDVSIDHLGIDDKLSNNLLRRFFDSKETTASQRIIGENFSIPFLKSVRDLQTAESISDVLETILGLSAAYDTTLQALHQEQEEAFDLTGDFYNDQVWEKDGSSKSGSLWVRQQANHAARKCQTAAAATAEVAAVGARIFVDLYNNPSEVPHAFQFKRDDKPARDVVEDSGDTAMDEYSDEVDPASSPSLPFGQDGLMSGPSLMVEEQKTSATQHHCNSVVPTPDGLSLDYLLSLDCNQFGIGDMRDGRNPTGMLLRTDSFGSSWQSDFGNDTSSENSWEVVRPLKNESTVGDEADALGNEFSDAEDLHVMLRDSDPFGKRECSPLINEFFSLKMNSATSSADDSDQEQSSCAQEGRETKVLERLASYSSSNSSNWSDHDILSSASSAKKKRTSPLQTLAEEPACDPDIARTYRSYVSRAATEGNVLQWCSCKFNKIRCSIELRFQVGAFMEDDIATLSTGISRESPLYVEIFLDSTNVRDSLLQGDVRVSAHQGDRFGYRGSWKHTEAGTVVLPPVAGLSCYIPHLVRQYLKQEVHTKRASSGYEFPEGELIIGLMQYVIAQLVFIKQTCCVCNHETQSDDVLTYIVPRPCEKNLCQALYGAWLGVTPRTVVELSTIEDWLKACFDELPLYEAYMKHFKSHQDMMWNGTYKAKVERVAKWLGRTILSGGYSWLRVVIPEPGVDDEFNEPNETARTAETPRGNVKTQAPKRRRRTSLERNDDGLQAKWWAEHNGSGTPPSSPSSPSSPHASPLSSDDFDMGQQHDDVTTSEFGRNGIFVFSSAPSPMRPRRDVPGLRFHSPAKQKQPVENLASTSAFSPYVTSGTAQREDDSSSFMVASVGPPGQARGKAPSTSQDDQVWDWKKVLEDLTAPSQAPRMTRVQELRMSAQAAPGEQCKSAGKRIHGESSSHDTVPDSWEDYN